MKYVFFYVTMLVLLTVMALSVNDVLNCKLVMASTSNSAYKLYRLFKQSPNDEIQVLGSSRATLHFVPSMFTQKCFNYGIQGSFMSETLLHLKQASTIDSELPIIVNLDPWGFQGSGGFVGDYKFVLDEKMVIDVLPSGLRSFSNRCLGIRFYGDLRKNCAGFLNIRKSKVDIIDNGAIKKNIILTNAEWEMLCKNISRTSKMEGFYYRADYQKALDEIYANTLRPIVWVVGPCASAWREVFKDDGSLKLFLEKQCGYPNVYAYDFFLHDYEDNLFMDLVHLNAKGADKFTRDLIERFCENPKLEKFFK